MLKCIKIHRVMTVITGSSSVEKPSPLKKKFFSSRRDETRVKIRENVSCVSSLVIKPSSLRNVEKNNVKVSLNVKFTFSDRALRNWNDKDHAWNHYSTVCKCFHSFVFELIASISYSDWSSFNICTFVCLEKSSIFRELVLYWIIYLSSIKILRVLEASRICKILSM